MNIVACIIGLCLGFLFGYMVCLFRYISEYTSLIEEFESQEERLQILKDEIKKTFKKDNRPEDNK